MKSTRFLALAIYLMRGRFWYAAILKLLLMASTGSILAADHAGAKPDTTPMVADTPSPISNFAGSLFVPIFVQKYVQNILNNDNDNNI